MQKISQLTTFSGMAINITMMFGRIGSVLGTNIVGLTLDKFCGATFVVSAAIMFLCGVLSFFIPKIRRVDGCKDNK
jgi:MFS transporter, VNT family, synaptic vesicle glycoprotein 2